MKKFITITFLVLCAIVGFMAAKLVSKTGTENTEPPSRTFPTSKPVRGIPTTSVATTSGQSVVVVQTATTTPVRELISEQTVQKLVAGATDLHDDGIYRLKEDPRYTVFFVAHAKYFAVRLKETVSDELLEQVGSYLSTVLSLSQEDLCKLNIDVFASASYDPSQSQDVGLPACPGPRAPSNGK